MNKKLLWIGLIVIIVGIGVVEVVRGQNRKSIRTGLIDNIKTAGTTQDKKAVLNIALKNYRNNRSLFSFMRSRADLVFVSACEEALQDLAAAELVLDDEAYEAAAGRVAKECFKTATPVYDPRYLTE